MTFGKTTQSEVIRFRMDFRQKAMSEKERKNLFNAGILLLTICLMGAIFSADPLRDYYKQQAIENQEMRASL